MAKKKVYTGPGGYRSTTRPFSSYKGPYPSPKYYKVGNTGIPVGYTAPDTVTNNTPPTLSRAAYLSKHKPVISRNPGSVTASALGVNGYTPAANFDLTNNGTSYDSTYTGIPQTNGVTASAQNSQPVSTTQTNSPQLMVSPTGQYTQIYSTTNIPKAATPKVSATKAKPKPKKKAKRPSYADSEYMSELNALQKELTDYKAKMGLNKTRAGTQHSLSARDLRQQGDRDRADLKDDFAARGIVLSGAYGSKLGEYNTLFGQQNAELDRQYKDALTDIANQYKDYNREIGVQKEQARLAAIRRRAQKLGKL